MIDNQSESEREGESDLAASQSRLIFHQLTLRAHLPHSFTQVPTSASGSALHPCEEKASGEGGKAERGREKIERKRHNKVSCGFTERDSGAFQGNCRWL